MINQEKYSVICKMALNSPKWIEGYFLAFNIAIHQEFQFGLKLSCNIHVLLYSFLFSLKVKTSREIKEHEDRKSQPVYAFMPISVILEN